MSDSIIKSLGAGSGIDTTSLVSQLVEIERAPLQSRLDTKEEKLDAQISAYGVLKSSLSELQSALSPLADNDTYNARSVAFPDTDVITPNSVDPGAQTGTYQIEVVDVARAQSLASAAQSDKDAALGASGTMTITFGEWTYNGSNEPIAPFTVNDEKAALNIIVEAGDSLQEIAEKINAEEDAGIQASVLLVDGQYQLLMTAPSGASNAMQITTTADGDDNGSLVDFEFNATNFSTMTETQQATDAELKVNGLTVYRDTNDIDDVIQGFDFTLNTADPGQSYTFSVSEDPSLAEQAIRDFVEAYNLFYETAENLTKYKEDEEGNTVRSDLATDGSAKAIINSIRGTIASAVPGVDDAFTALTNVGIRTELDGTLSIDEDDFNLALNDNFELIESLFATDTSSSSDKVKVSVGSYANNTVAGDYDIAITTDPVKGAIQANVITNTAFDNGADDFGALGGSLNTGLLGNYSFVVTVDGTESNEITLTGDYTTVEELRADLQSLINGDTNLKEARAAVDVTYDTATDQFLFTSRQYGSSSNVSFSGTTVETQSLGLADSGLTVTAGVDAAGTIGGEAAFGSGNILLPALDSDPYGLNFTILEGATADTVAAGGSLSINFSRGFAGELSNLIDEFLSNTGAIKTREDSINSQLNDVESDREDLDRKMERVEARLYSQFLAMERIVSSFQSTGDQLDGILERLPFTASNS
ncbi:flagellar filament capping protein FliD [Neptuniibacter sp.]|uniref:flagellar filament capping protein FliD n=1 Tax=Neptuniibacter sp. TaxID=1962643 RepID=UPI00261803AE|nr:flagellar filament capping protein FliD [Neptuniibacter sp.]MCP4595918.1 flagellar filament capping protein FliD [Neptuniibacter sp.]